jgi:LmbE family N-acetylglucosaminyl deacetylase
MPAIDVAHGTDEETWISSSRMHNLPAFDWPTAGRIAVVAPHPDDETLGVGGAMCIAKRLGLTVELIALTEGEASHSASATLSRTRLANVRGVERLQAMRALGLSNVEPRQLHIPDGAVTKCADLVDRLIPLIRDVTHCFAPLRNDGHPDHDAAGIAAATACALCGVQLCEYPIWAWNWAGPNSLDLPWSRARRVALPDYAEQAKRIAVGAYRSQIAIWPDSSARQAIVPPRVLAHFLRDFEVLFV